MGLPRVLDRIAILIILVIYLRNNTAEAGVRGQAQYEESADGAGEQETAPMTAPERKGMGRLDNKIAIVTGAGSGIVR